jgi:hypothetical protein
VPPAGTKDLGSNMYYVRSDYEFVDYQIYEHQGYWLRGPAPETLVAGNYITFAGAAQTFGRFAAEPFPTRVGKALNAPVLNLGFGAYGPGDFGYGPELLKAINAGRFLVLQVMAGRSASNSAMVNTAGRHVDYQGQNMTAEAAWQKAIEDDSLTAERFWTLVDETRQDWLDQYAALITRIEVPIVLLYIGADAPRCKEDRSRKPADLAALTGRHPQLVTQDMFDTVAAQCQRVVESVTDYGLPQPLTAPIYDEKGQPGQTVNEYYPSPEMHLAAARKLFPVCRELWTA